MKQKVCGVEEAVDILRQIANTPLATEIQFKFVAKVDALPTVEYYVKKFAWGGKERREDADSDTDTDDF